MFDLVEESIVLLHLSHTDIRRDSRILKEMTALASIPRSKVIGIGFELGETEAPTSLQEDDRIEILTKVLLTRKWRALPRGLRYVFNFVELTFKLIRPAFQSRPSVVHCHDTLALPAAWLVSVCTGCKLVYDAHELESDKNGQTRLLSIFTLWIERLAWPRLDLLVSVSNHILDWYNTHLGYKQAVLVLNSPVFRNAVAGVQKSSFDEKHYFQKKFGLNSDAVIFVYLGILGAGRGIELCLNAFASGPKNAHVVFVGYGAYEVRIQESARRCSNIHFHPAVPHDQVVPLVSKADFGLCLVENVSLSDYYCLPNKLFEYAFANLPVLASRFPEISCLVEKYSLGICCDLDEKSVCEALHKIVSTRPNFPISDISDLSWSAQAIRLIYAYNNLFVSSR